MNSTKTFLFILLFFEILFSGQEKNHIAVLNFESKGLAPNEASILSDRFRSSLVSNKSFLVIERSEMKDILEEQGFQLSGCTSSECAIEAGKILNVNKIVTGSIGKFGDLFTIDIRMIDVESAEITKSFSKEFNIDHSELLNLITLIAMNFDDDNLHTINFYDLLDDGSSSTLLWTSIGVVSIGILVYFILNSSNSNKKVASDLPVPPGTP